MHRDTHCASTMICIVICTYTWLLVPCRCVPIHTSNAGRAVVRIQGEYISVVRIQGEYIRLPHAQERIYLCPQLFTQHATHCIHIAFTMWESGVKNRNLGLYSSPCGIF